MRIIAGKHKGRKLLDCHKLKDLRPTTDRNREALFNILSNASFLQEIDFNLKNCHLLDVFSGSGSVSFEALSRGVHSATLIDKNSNHINLAQENAKILNEDKNCNFVNFDLQKPIFQSQKQYNLVFIDPPYGQDLLLHSFINLQKGNFLAKNALIIFERSIHDDFKIEIDDLKFLCKKTYSKTIFDFYYILK
jgi:16S rRNA (guanine966-N2)-methyltransferase